jgi:fructan beta-fructosidase
MATLPMVGQSNATSIGWIANGEKLIYDIGSKQRAAQTWSHLPSSDGRRIMLAWMNDWRYADKLPTRRWRGQMTFPRTLGLLQTKDGIRLTQAPVHEIESIRDEHIQLRNTRWTEAEALLARRAWPGHCRDCCRSEVPGDARRRFRTAKGASHETRVGYNAKRSTVYINRTHSGDAIVSSEFRAKHEGQSR